jgi:hypothetical protein
MEFKINVQKNYCHSRAGENVGTHNLYQPTHGFPPARERRCELNKIGFTKKVLTYIKVQNTVVIPAQAGIQLLTTWTNHGFPPTRERRCELDKVGFTKKALT